MAARQFQRFSNPADQLYNLPTDPASYPLFTSFDERDEYIRNLLLVEYQNEMAEEIKDEIQGEDINTWLSDQVAEWARENNFTGQYDISELSRQIGLYDDEPPRNPAPFDRDSYNFRQAAHLPMHPRLHPRFLTHPPQRHSNPTPRSRRGRSRERSRSPSRRSPGPGRRGDSPESSPWRSGRRGQSPQSSRGRSSRSNSPQRTRSPGTAATLWSDDSRERSLKESRGTSLYDSPDRSSRGSGSSSSDSGESSLSESGSNSPQRSGSPKRGTRWSSDDSPEGSRRGRRSNTSQTNGSPGRNPAGQRGNPVAAPSEEDEIEFARRTHSLMLEREINKRLKPFEDMFYIAFVGEQAHPPLDGFEPCRGDLIISHPDTRYIGLPNSVGYIASYLGSYNFSPRDLLLRVGTLETIPASGAFPGDASYKPFTSLQLYAYHRTRFSSWKFLGHQAELRNSVDFHNPPDVSPGKFLRVGTPVLGPSSIFIEALVPRRGDVIIKREVWVEDFSHAENFWYSMVKWHRGRQFPFLAGDMLVRLLVDNDARNRKSGWAELYKYEGTSVGWVFWGRTQHVLDTPWPEAEGERHIVLYEYDDGAVSGDEIQKQRVDPRLDSF